MLSTVRLYEIAAAEGIELVTHGLPHGVLGYYIAAEDTPPIITLSPLLDDGSPLFRCVLAEELGHHFTTVGDALPRKYFHYSDRIKISRAEYRALCWAAKTLMPIGNLRLLLAQGQTTTWEIAESFVVTETMACFRARMLGAL